MSIEVTGVAPLTPANTPAPAEGIVKAAVSNTKPGPGLGVNAAVAFDPNELRANLHDAVELLNQQIEANGRDLAFQIDETLNRPVITVIRASSGEVVRQIPTEVVLRVAHNIELVKGMLIDELS